MREGLQILTIRMMTQAKEKQILLGVEQPDKGAFEQVKKKLYKTLTNKTENRTLRQKLVGCYSVKQFQWLDTTGSFVDSITCR